MMANHLLMIGTSELLLIAALVLLLFGGKKLPEMMKGLGQGVRSFKDGMREVTEPEDDMLQSKQLHLLASMMMQKNSQRMTIR